MSRSMKGPYYALVGASLLLSSSAMAGEITVWCWDPNFNGAIMQEAGARYTAKHPGTTIKVVDFAKGDTLHEWEVPFDWPDDWPEAIRTPFDAFHTARQAMQRRMDQSIKKVLSGRKVDDIKVGEEGEQA